MRKLRLRGAHSCLRPEASRLVSNPAQTQTGVVRALFPTLFSMVPLIHCHSRQLTPNQENFLTPPNLSGEDLLNRVLPEGIFPLQGWG